MSSVGLGKPNCAPPLAGDTGPLCPTPAAPATGAPSQLPSAADVVVVMPTPSGHATAKSRSRRPSGERHDRSRNPSPSETRTRRKQDERGGSSESPVATPRLTPPLARHTLGDGWRHRSDSGWRQWGASQVRAGVEWGWVVTVFGFGDPRWRDVKNLSWCRRWRRIMMFVVSYRWSNQLVMWM